MAKAKTKRKARVGGNEASFKVRGFFRINIMENGKIVGDSGWRKNIATYTGIQDYICATMGALAGSKTVSRMCLGTGTAPAVGDTALNGELNTATYTRTTVTLSTIASRTLQALATFASTSSHITASVALSNMGLINNTTSGGTLLCGNTYASSAWNTNQDLNCTYQLRFSTA